MTGFQLGLQSLQAQDLLAIKPKGRLVSRTHVTDEKTATTSEADTQPHNLRPGKIKLLVPFWAQLLLDVAV